MSRLDLYENDENESVRRKNEQEKKQSQARTERINYTVILN